MLICTNQFGIQVSNCCLTPTQQFFQLYHGENKLIFNVFFTDLELADYCNLNRDIDKRILNDLLMSKMFLKYTESWHINVNAVASMTRNGRNKRKNV